MRQRLRHLPIGLAASGVVLCVAGLVSWLVGGGHGLTGSVVAVVLVTASYVLSSLVVAWADTVHPTLVLPVGLATYATKFILLGVALVLLQRGRWPGLPSFAWTVVASVLGWVGVQVWWVWHAQVPYVTLDGNRRQR